MTVLLAEEILDDGVGLLLESSGDSLDDDSEIFSEFDECRKVRAPDHFLFVECDGVQHVLYVMCWLLRFIPVLVLPASPSALRYHEKKKKALKSRLLQHSLMYHLLLAHFVLFKKAE